MKGKFILTEQTSMNIAKIFCGRCEKDNLFEEEITSAVSSFFSIHFGYDNNRIDDPLLSYNEYLTQIVEDDLLNEYFNTAFSYSNLRRRFKGYNKESLNLIAYTLYEKVNTALEASNLKIEYENFSIKLLAVDDYIAINGGGFSYIYHNPKTNVVMKKLKEGYYDNEGIVHRFHREFEIEKELTLKDYVIKVIAFNEEEHYYTMKYMNQTLRDLIEKNIVSIEVKIDIITRLLLCVSELHQMEYIHRDLNPNNIFIENGKPILSDFGLAKNLNQIYSHVTIDTSRFGTVNYVDEEQLSALTVESGKATRFDIYSLGKIINFIMTGSPNNEEHPFKVVTIKSCIKKENRYKSVEELFTAFRGIVSSMEEEQNKRNLWSSIYNKNVDSAVCKFILSLDGIDLFSNMRKFDFRYCFVECLYSINDTDEVINAIDRLYNEALHKHEFHEYDPVGQAALSILYKGFNDVIREKAAELLNYCSYTKHRFDTNKAVEKFKRIRHSDSICSKLLTFS